MSAPMAAPNPHSPYFRTAPPFPAPALPRPQGAQPNPGPFDARQPSASAFSPVHARFPHSTVTYPHAYPSPDPPAHRRPLPTPSSARPGSIHAVLPPTPLPAAAPPSPSSRPYHRQTSSVSSVASAASTASTASYSSASTAPRPLPQPGRRDASPSGFPQPALPRSYPVPDLARTASAPAPAGPEGAATGVFPPTFARSSSNGSPHKALPTPKSSGGQPVALFSSFPTDPYQSASPPRALQASAMNGAQPSDPYAFPHAHTRSNSGSPPKALPTPVRNGSQPASAFPQHSLPDIARSVGENGAMPNAHAHVRTRSPPKALPTPGLPASASTSSSSTTSTLPPASTLKSALPSASTNASGTPLQSQSQPQSKFVPHWRRALPSPSPTIERRGIGTVPSTPTAVRPLPSPTRAVQFQQQQQHRQQEFQQHQHQQRAFGQPVLDRVRSLPQPTIAPSMPEDRAPEIEQEVRQIAGAGLEPAPHWEKEREKEKERESERTLQYGMRDLPTRPRAQTTSATLRMAQLPLRPTSPARTQPPSSSAAQIQPAVHTQPAHHKPSQSLPQNRPQPGPPSAFRALPQQQSRIPHVATPVVSAFPRSVPLAISSASANASTGGSSSGASGSSSSAWPAGLPPLPRAPSQEARPPPARGQSLGWRAHLAQSAASVSTPSTPSFGSSVSSVVPNTAPNPVPSNASPNPAPSNSPPNPAPSSIYVRTAPTPVPLVTQTSPSPPGSATSTTSASSTFTLSSFPAPPEHEAGGWRRDAAGPSASGQPSASASAIPKIWVASVDAPPRPAASEPEPTASVPTISLPDGGDDADADDDGVPTIAISAAGADFPPRIGVSDAPSTRSKGRTPSPPQIAISSPASTSSGSTSSLRRAEPPPRKIFKPSGGSLACGGCGGVIVGRTVSAMGARWHPGCFRCCVCDELLENLSSYEYDGRAYCHLDYHERFAPKCYHCQTAIVDERFITLDDPELGQRTYHEQHFFCAECGDPFLAPKQTARKAASGAGRHFTGDGAFGGGDDDVGFTVYRGHPYCESCHVRLRNPKCKQCRRPIRDGARAVEALGAKWCWECFVCAGCEKPFEDPAFFQREGRPFCEHCFSVMIKSEL